jgi:hypothetical protein
MSKVSDLEFVHSEVLRNGTLLDVAEPSLVIRRVSRVKESNAQAKSPVASEEVDMEVEEHTATDSEACFENGLSSANETSNTTERNLMNLAKNVSDANGICCSTATEDRLPVASPSQDCASNDDIVEDPMNADNGVAKPFTPRETSHTPLLSIGPYVTHCSKHYGERPHMSSDQTGVDDSWEMLNPSGSAFVHAPPKQNEINSQPLESNAMPDHTSTPRRRLYISRTLQQLEDATKNWFTRENRKDADNSPPRPKDAIDLFSLKYNEASVSTIAAWVAGGSTRKRSSTTFHRPIVDTRFRTCSICGMYGHYEVECQSLTPDQTILLSRILSGEASVTNEYSTMKIKHYDYDVLIENCDGFFIEQQSNDNYNLDAVSNCSKKALNGVKNPMQERQCAVKGGKKIKMELDGFSIVEEPALESTTSPESSVLPNHEPEPIQVGSLVTWFLGESDNKNDFGQNAILVGVVAKIDADAGRAQVEILRFICAESKSIENYRVATETNSSVGSLVWVRAPSLYLVDEQNEVLQSNKRFSKNSKKVAKPPVVKRSRTKKAETIVKEHSRFGRPNLNPDTLSKNPKRGRKPSKSYC